MLFFLGTLPLVALLLDCGGPFFSTLKFRIQLIAIFSVHPPVDLGLQLLDGQVRKEWNLTFLIQFIAFLARISRAGNLVPPSRRNAYRHTYFVLIIPRESEGYD